jgi:hypothetical protein
MTKKRRKRKTKTKTKRKTKTKTKRKTKTKTKRKTKTKTKRKTNESEKVVLKILWKRRAYGYCLLHEASRSPQKISPHVTNRHTIVTAG